MKARIVSSMMNRIKVSGLALGLWAAAALPASAGGVSVTYKVDVGPMTLSTVKFTLDLGAEAVLGRAKIETSGLSRVFAEYTAVAESESAISAEALRPVRFRLVRQRDDDRRETSLNWSPAGDLTYDPPIPKPDRRARIENALGQGVSDPITTVLRIGAAGVDPCPSVHDVFDGRDVFQLALTDLGKGELDDDTGYRGPVQRCSVRWTPVAGRAKDRNSPGDSYDVAFAPVGKLPSGRDLWLPVLMSGSLKGLPFRAYAERVKARD
jgi:hypothetical protein